jgi:F-type H+-transporting ATPase subunit b
MVLLAFAEQVQLLPDLTLFIHVGMILVMIWFLNRTFFKPINRILEKRERNRGGHMGEAQEILSEIAEKDAEYSAGLLEARNEGYEFIEKERGAAIDHKVTEVASAKKEVAEFLGAELGELDRQTSEAETAIREEAEKMADKISANVLRAV